MAHRLALATLFTMNSAFPTRERTTLANFTFIVLFV